MEKLTARQQQVFDAIEARNEPVTAYDLLESLGDLGFKAPAQVYRPLERLLGLGLVHKIESKNAFLACQSTTCRQSHIQAYVICEACAKTTEISLPGVNEEIKKAELLPGFSFSSARLEVTGRCADCVDA